MEQNLDGGEGRGIGFGGAVVVDAIAAGSAANAVVEVLMPYLNEVRSSGT